MGWGSRQAGRKVTGHQSSVMSAKRPKQVTHRAVAVLRFCIIFLIKRHVEPSAAEMPLQEPRLGHIPTRKALLLMADVALVPRWGWSGLSRDPGPSLFLASGDLLLEGVTPNDGSNRSQQDRSGHQSLQSCREDSGWWPWYEGSAHSPRVMRPQAFSGDAKVKPVRDNGSRGRAPGHANTKGSAAVALHG